jgi:hypothetical protein
VGGSYPRPCDLNKLSLCTEAVGCIAASTAFLFALAPNRGMSPLSVGAVGRLRTKESKC